MEAIELAQKQLVDVFVKAKRVFVFTGAGVSKESGLPTFRDTEGTWRDFDPMTYATMEGFIQDPAQVWNMYRLRQRQISHAQPNPAHKIIALMEEYYPHFLLATQNVDDLHERAGSRKMVKMHGDAWLMRCLDNGHVFDVRELDFPDEFTLETLPRCPVCDSICRPHIVWFGEYLDQEIMWSAIDAASNCDLMLMVGTSGEVSNGYGFCEYALGNGATVVEVNPSRGHLTCHAQFWIPEPAGVALPRIWKQVTGEDVV